MFPKLITIHGFVLPTYGVLVAMGFISGLLVAIHLSQREGLDREKIYNLGIYVALAGMLGSKLFLLIQDRKYYFAHPGDLFSMATLQSGGIFYGGLLTAIAVAAWYSLKGHIPFLKLGDAFAPGIALGHAFGRLGCFSAGCCWGKPTNLPWGVTFTDPYANEVVGVPLGVPLHPTQIYEAIGEAIIFAILYANYRRKKFDGQVLGWYLLMYPTVRLLVEFLRTHVDEALLWNTISDAQLISILLIGMGFWLLWLGPYRRRELIPVTASGSMLSASAAGSRKAGTSRSARAEKLRGR
jgi:phosphatidylglycerol---prolipoprotein diacylglyceryl transferase